MVPACSRRCLPVGLALLVAGLAGCGKTPADGDAGSAAAEDGPARGTPAQVGPDAGTPQGAGTVSGQGTMPAAADADAGAGTAAEPSALPPAIEPPPGPRCPPEMVRVAGRVCVDRYEALLVDAVTNEAVSPYYPPARKIALATEKLWDKQRLSLGDEEAQRLPLPILPPWQRAREIEPKAVSRKGAVPQGYTSGKIAELACRNAGKRLCTLDEWRTACRGERDRPFPYGEAYIAGKCNVFREAHPAALLHGNPSIGHSDPRLNLVRHAGKPLLRRTGETRSCASQWDGDAVYDMVGNIDEWIDDPEGTFVGGFYSRAKKDGCASIVATHPLDYYDYSTGIRCCSDGRSP